MFISARSTTVNFLAKHGGLSKIMIISNIVLLWCAVTISISPVIQCIRLKTKLPYTYNSTVLKTVNSTPKESSTTTYQSCPPLFAYNNSLQICNCRNVHPLSEALKCDNKRYQVLQCYCTSYDDANGVEVSYCIYGCSFQRKELAYNALYQQLPLDAHDWDIAICRLFKRRGVDCGKCDNNSFLPAYSYNMICSKCGNQLVSGLKYILLAFFPLTIFYFVVLILRLNIPLWRLQAYVFFCQIITTPLLIRQVLLMVRHNHKLIQWMKFFGSIFSFWNLDFLRLYDFEICFKLSNLTIVSLDLLVAAYPILLMMITYWLVQLYGRNIPMVTSLWNRIKHLLNFFQMKLDIKTSTIDAFATFMLLSNEKFLSVSFDLLMPKRVFHLDTNGDYTGYSWRLFYDGSIPYFGKEHLPFGILGIFISVVFICTPVLLLLFTSFRIGRKMFFSRLSVRTKIFLHIYLDSFQGRFRDGTSPGSTNFRVFSGFFLILRLLVFLLYAALLFEMFFAYNTMLLVLASLLMIITGPYKEKYKQHEYTTVIFLLLLSSISCSVSIFAVQNDDKWLKINLAIISLILTCFVLYVGVVLFQWVILKTKRRLFFS